MIVCGVMVRTVVSTEVEYQSAMFTYQLHRCYNVLHVHVGVHVCVCTIVVRVRSYIQRLCACCSMGQPADALDQFNQSSRACGGPHTLTYPHRRTTRAQHLK